MSAAVSRSPANQDRPFLMQSPLPSDQRAGGRMRTLLDLLTVEKMDGMDGTLIRSSGAAGGSKWRVLKERLGLTVTGCCGVSTWPYGSPQEPLDEDDANEVVLVDDPVVQESVSSTQETRRQQEEGSMNLATALAAERQYRAASEEGGATPLRVSLMRLLEETSDGCDVERDRRGECKKESEGVVGVEGSDSVCCVCMGRKKGAAFIPCGHTYCRVCSRELWLNRGSCPLCNRRILEILDIF